MKLAKQSKKFTFFYIVLVLSYVGVVLSASDVFPEAEENLTVESEICLLNEENPGMIEEFFDIIQLYQKLPSSPQERINLYRRLLSRLNRMQPDTPFLEGQQKIYQAVMRYNLGIRPTSYSNLENVIRESSCKAIRDDAMRVLLDQGFRSGDPVVVRNVFQAYAESFSPKLREFVAVVLKNPEEISQDEASFAIHYLMENGFVQLRDASTSLRILTMLDDKVELADIDRLIEHLLNDNQLSKAVSFMKIRVQREVPNFDLLMEWSQRLKDQEHYLVHLLKNVSDNNDVIEYLDFYSARHHARTRGRMFNKSLYAYRGSQKAPYNAERVDRLFAEYLQGELEDKYLVANSERAVRNFLAFKRYDKIVEHLEPARDKMWDGFFSSYINFWLAYAHLEQGNTNAGVTLLGEVIAREPETYFGILSYELINTVFKKSPPSRTKYLVRMKENIYKDKKSRIRYATLMHHIGTYLERGQAEKILIAEGVISASSKKEPGKTVKLLSDAYLTLGLEDGARSVLFHDGINNPFEQDRILSSFYLDRQQHPGFRNLYTQRSDLVRGKFSASIGRDALQAYYPKPYQDDISIALSSLGHNVDEGLVYAIIRTESFYKPEARSKVGARGLMQLMPTTAQFVAKKVLPDTKNYNIYDPKINVMLGTSYLYDNIQNLGLLPALAAYNGGPTTVSQLKKSYMPKNHWELVEIHPFRETRNYVKKVIESYHRYSLIYEGRSLNMLPTFDVLFY